MSASPAITPTPAAPRAAPAAPAGDEPRRRRPVLRVVVTWLTAAATLMLLSAVLSSVDVDSFAAALGSAALIGLINAFVWPVVIRLALPITVLTLGLGVLALNGAVVLAVAAIDTGLHVSGLAAAVIVAVCLTVMTTVVTSLLAIDDNDFFERNVVRRRARRSAGAVSSDVPGLLFLEIDGLAHDVLVRAMRDGNAPTMARWLRSGSHHLARWETDWSSQTGACQAGLLHGDNDDMPAFRWWEKDRDAAIVTNHPKDAMELERRHSSGRGLLFDNGASRANILSGDAPRSLLTMSTVLQRDRPGRIGQDYFAYFANPYNLLRTMALMAREVASELWSAAQQRRLDVRPRVHRGFVYSLVRAWATVVQRDLQVEAIIADLYAGLPVAYTTFLAYDEVAHHSGIERSDTLATLRQVDRQIGRIAAAAEHAPRPYRFVVLSDHGQSQGATFLDRFGLSLEDVVTRASGADSVQVASDASDVATGYARASVGRSEHEPDTGEAGELPELSVMASGCLGLISFPREPGRVTLEWIESHHPHLIQTLREHPGIGFLLVRSRERGPLVIGGAGTHELASGTVEGEDPLAPF